MNHFLLTPPAAFLIFLVVAAIIYLIGRRLAGPEEPSALKSSIYSGGEANHTVGGAPGYRPFFIIALFFAILHLGVLTIGTGGLTWMIGVYLIGLILVLIALILG
jgi:NADH:ubiquinone oxidoreductase subunit 3 (subunit A)